MTVTDNDTEISSERVREERMTGWYDNYTSGLQMQKNSLPDWTTMISCLLGLCPFRDINMRFVAAVK